MKAIYVNRPAGGGIPYPEAIVRGHKAVETRNRNTLGKLVGERVGIIDTRRGEIIGYAVISSAHYTRMPQAWDAMRDLTLVPPGSMFDWQEGKTRIKWLYRMTDATPCDPYPIPENAVRHGRVWVEW